MTSPIAPSSPRMPRGQPIFGIRQHPVVLVSNRLATTVRREADGIRLSVSSGGLSSALRWVHARSSRPWIGWSGVAQLPAAVQLEVDAALSAAGALPVPLREEEVDGFYRRFANAVLWPLLHEERPEAPPDPAAWATYQEVNERFARCIARGARAGDRVWVHDYQLLLLPRLLRRLLPTVPIGFFLHTPFPTVETLNLLPMAGPLIEGMLGADAIGFQTRADVERFAAAVRLVLGCRVELTSGTGIVHHWTGPACLYASPISIDVSHFAARAAEPGVRRRADALRARGGTLVLGIDRLDPTKGIPQRLAAFERLLELRPELRGRVRLIQVAVPSREELPSYKALRARVEAKVEGLNARFGASDWKPVEYRYETIEEEELVALYQAAAVMLVTPLRDGMNLVAKEFVASRSDERGVLVLSRHAGAATELTSALLVDPNRIDELALACARALEMSPEEQRLRMRRLRSTVRTNNVGRWAGECLRQLDAAARLRRERLRAHG
jgi:trehalose 6-phosphate synthase/phosphatase